MADRDYRVKGSGRKKKPVDLELSQEDTRVDRGTGRVDQYKEKDKKANPVKRTSNDKLIGYQVETTKSKYTIYRLIAQGKFCRVFEVKKEKDDTVLACKIHLKADPGKSNLLRHEAYMYNFMKKALKCDKEDYRIMPIQDYGECDGSQFLLMSLGGPSLKMLMGEGKLPELDTAFDITSQMLECIYQLNNIGIVHGRIRPECFILGRRTNTLNRLHIINFAFSRNVRSTDYHGVPPKDTLVLTDRYAPRVMHTGLTYLRRDDLESWFYICCDLFHPHFLPWSRDKKYRNHDLLDMKEKLMSGEMLNRFSVLPKSFQTIVGQIFETDAKMPHYECMYNALARDATDYKVLPGKQAIQFRTVANLPPVPSEPEQQKESAQTLPSNVGFENDYLKARARALGPSQSQSNTQVSSQSQVTTQESQGKLQTLSSSVFVPVASRRKPATGVSGKKPAAEPDSDLRNSEEEEKDKDADVQEPKTNFEEGEFLVEQPAERTRVPEPPSNREKRGGHRAKKVERVESYDTGPKVRSPSRNVAKKPSASGATPQVSRKTQTNEPPEDDGSNDEVNNDEKTVDS